MRAVITIEQQVIKIETVYKILRLNPEYHLRNIVKHIKEGNIPPEYEYIFGTYAVVELIESNKRGRPPTSKLTQQGKIYKLTKKLDSINLDLHVNKKKANNREIQGVYTLYNKMWNDFFDKIVFIKTPLKFFQGFEKSDYRNYRLYRTLFLERTVKIDKMGTKTRSTYIFINAFFEFPTSVIAETLLNSVDISPFILNETGKFVVFFREFTGDQLNLKDLTNSSFPNEEYLKDLEKFMPNYLNTKIPSVNFEMKVLNQKICEYKTMSDVDKIFSNYSSDIFKELGVYKNSKLVSSIENKYFKKVQTGWKNSSGSPKNSPTIEDLRKVSNEKYSDMESKNDTEKKRFKASVLGPSFRHLQTPNTINNLSQHNNTPNGLKTNNMNSNKYNNYTPGHIFNPNMSRFGDLPPAQYDLTSKTPLQGNYINNLNRNPINQYNDINEYGFIPPINFPPKRSIEGNPDTFNHFKNNNLNTNAFKNGFTNQFESSKPFYNKDKINPSDNSFNYTQPGFVGDSLFKANINPHNKANYIEPLNKKEERMFNETIKPIKHNDTPFKNKVNGVTDKQGIPVYTPFRNYIKDDPLPTITEQRMPDTFTEYMEQQEKKKENPVKTRKEEIIKEEESTEAMDMPVFLT